MDCPTGVPTRRCVTIMDIAGRNSGYFISNTQINFFSGVHSMTSNTGVWTDRLEIYNLSLRGEQTGNTVIHCNGTQVGFLFHSVVNFTLSRVSISRCGLNVSKMIHDYTSHQFIYIKEKEISLHPSVYASLLLMNVEEALLQDVVIQNGTGIGLFAIAFELIGNITLSIESSKFQYNKVDCLYNNGRRAVIPGGNVFIQMSQFTEYNAGPLVFSGYYSLTISNCQFLHGRIWNQTHLYTYPIKFNGDEFGHSSSTAVFQHSAGLTVSADGLAKVTIASCSFVDNLAPLGAHLSLYLIDIANTTVRDCKFLKASSLGNRGGVLVTVSYSIMIGYKKQRIIHFTDSVFMNNYGSAIEFESILSTSQAKPTTILMQNLIFKNNRATAGAAIKADLNKYLVYLLNGCTFIANEAIHFGGALLINDTQEDKDEPKRLFNITQSGFTKNKADIGSALYVIVLEKRDHLATNIIFELCIPSKRGHCEL